MNQGYLIKSMTGIKLIFAVLIVIACNGCTFIVKDDNLTKYYGVNEKRDIEFLNKILGMQQEIYQGQKDSGIIIK
jgi:heterodisulfide reductase subunit B